MNYVLYYLIVLSISFCLIQTHQHENKIYFTLTSDGNKLTKMAKCAVLSTCTLNPTSNIVLISQQFIETNISSSQCSNIIQEVVAFNEIFVGTPLSDWYNKIAKRY